MKDNKIPRPLHIQTFDDVPVDLLAYRGIYQRYLEIAENEATTPSYGESNLAQTLELTRNNPVYQKMFNDKEKEEVLQNVAFEFEQAAKEKLREEYPIIDQLVLQAKLEKQNNEAL